MQSLCRSYFQLYASPHPTGSNKSSRRAQQLLLRSISQTQAGWFSCVYGTIGFRSGSSASCSRHQCPAGTTARSALAGLWQTWLPSLAYRSAPPAAAPVALHLAPSGSVAKWAVALFRSAYLRSSNNRATLAAACKSFNLTMRSPNLSTLLPAGPASAWLSLPDI